MTLQSFLVFLPAMLSGSLLIHLLWPEREPAALLLKASLGAGLGLGLASILYFISLLLMPGKVNLLPVTLAVLAALGIVVLLRERGQRWDVPRMPLLSRLQWGLSAASALAAVFMMLTFANLATALPQGAFDAWSIWNRAARFLYRDTENWHATLSPELYWENHADYPLLVPLNIAWGWKALGAETTRTPIVQAAVFLLGSAGLLFAALSLTRTPAQAALGVLLLCATPFLTLSASGLLADVPIQFFILASLVLMFLALTRGQGPLMALSGLMAGLAGWTKNEGLLFILAAVLGLALTRYKDMRRSLVLFISGLVLPLAVILTFKGMAPPGDLLAAGSSALMSRLTDPARYWTILKALGGMVLQFGDWPLSLLAVLAVYALIAGFAPREGTRQTIFTIGAIIVLQFLGYCAVFLLSPHDLEWHLRTSLARLLLQVFPSGLFVYLLLVHEPEVIFGGDSSKNRNMKGTKYTNI